MRLEVVAIVILLIAICNNRNSSAFIDKQLQQFIQRTLEDLRGLPKQNIIWAKEQKDRIHGRLPYDDSSAGQILDGMGSGLPLNTRSRSYEIPPTSSSLSHSQPSPPYY